MRTLGLQGGAEKQKSWRLPEIRHLHCKDTAVSQSLHLSSKAPTKDRSRVMEQLDAKLQHPSTIHVIQEGQRGSESVCVLPTTYVSGKKSQKDVSITSSF